MEDWEQFFVEKSRRRAASDRRERKRGRILLWTGGFILGAVIISGIVALGVTR